MRKLNNESRGRVPKNVRRGHGRDVAGVRTQRNGNRSAVGLMIKCNTTVTFFDCQFARKSKNVLTASAIATKRPEAKH
jgi:hypothetical protein